MSMSARSLDFFPWKNQGSEKFRGRGNGKFDHLLTPIAGGGVAGYALPGSL